MTAVKLEGDLLPASQLVRLELLAAALKKNDSHSYRSALFNHTAEVKRFFEENPALEHAVEGLRPEEQLAIMAVIAIGQGKQVLGRFFDAPERLQALAISLLPVERFYAEVGGIVGYHWMMLRLLQQKTAEKSEEAVYLRPDGFDLTADTEEARQATLWGIANLPKMGEIYPLGGAADRLRLHDEKSGQPLPAARLLFLGKTLLEGMIADLQARESLYYKLFGTSIVTPIAIMTSLEKDNHRHILSICEELHWFGRPKESFRFLCQPSVPTMTQRGEWCLTAPLKPLLKPGGHGVLWKLARDEGVFSWLQEQGRSKIVIRQVNNPMGSIDNGLLAFIGLGCKHDKIFGFASCPRQVKTSEGVNVLIEKEQGNFRYTLTNIEYCDFKKFNIVDQPVKKGSPFSKFPSNTNILFADIGEVVNAVAHAPIPGVLVNLKKTSYRDEAGEAQEVEVARLESTMQNLADHFEEQTKEPLKAGKRSQLKVFLTYNKREKTISAIKREFVLGAALLETPEGCFLDFLMNGRDLLVNACHFTVPEVRDGANFFAKGPSFIFLYHPALGPLYSIIAQKLRRGHLAVGAELQLDIAEVDIEDLDIDGSLRVRALAPMGTTNSSGILEYSNGCGRCRLRNVKVVNEGIDRDAANVFWRNEIYRKQACEIVIHGNGEFVAENITLPGDLHIEVKAGTRVTAKQTKRGLTFHEEKITAPSWTWNYTQTDDSHVLLSKNM
jgi:hypothetical protein